MGQAKQRGTLEQRKAAAIARNKAALIAHEEARRAREAAKSPQQREAEKRSRKAFNELALLTALSNVITGR